MTVGNEISYYLRPVNGDDSNDGTSFATAWKTWQKVIDEMFVSGVTGNNAALFLVNEGGAYTGPYHTGTGESSGVGDIFTASTYFQVCGVSADGSYDPDTNFEFDLSGFTGANWLYAFGGNLYKGILFRNITWKNANNTYTNSIINQLYSQNFNRTTFERCNFIDNELGLAIFATYGFGENHRYYRCTFRNNNSYNASYGLLGLATSNGNNVGTAQEDCIFDSNQTASGSSNYVISLNHSGLRVKNCAFYNNGYDENSICVNFVPYIENHSIDVTNNIFFNNAGTALLLQDTILSDPDYSQSNYLNEVTNNVFAYNNKSIDIQAEPGLRNTFFTHNVFYNNTVEDIPDLIETLPGSSGGNFVFDPEFNNGYSGDFSVPHDSRLFTKSSIGGIPIGGSFVQRRLFTTTTSGSLSLGTADVGDTVTVSGKSYQKVNQNPPVWRRFITQPPLTGTFSPSSLSSLVGWFDASDSDTIGISGGTVTYWNDKSASGVNLTQSVVANQPSYSDGWMVFNSDYMILDSELTGNRVVFFVTRNIQDNIVLDYTIVPIHSDNQASNDYTFITSVQAEPRNYDISIDGQIGTTGFASINGGSLVSGTNIELGTVNQTESNFWYSQYNTGIGIKHVGYLNYGPEPKLVGDLGEILIFDSVISDTDRRRIEGYLAHKWGLASKLSPTHPFKNYAP